MDLPHVFCWTKMGSEAGQTLEAILRRKELERDAGSGMFAWGIGSSIGLAAAEARGASPTGELEVLFTAMKAMPRQVDREPSQLLLWLSYEDDAKNIDSLPEHVLVTSRGGAHKRTHYALLCRSDQQIDVSGELATLDAACARNLRTHNPVGASQVTSVVTYQCDYVRPSERIYKVAFRATLHAAGFVRLLAPVALEGALSALYEQACNATTVDEWRSGVTALKKAARRASNHGSFKLFA